jgi:hypothetical protein
MSITAIFRLCLNQRCRISQQQSDGLAGRHHAKGGGHGDAGSIAVAVEAAVARIAGIGRLRHALAREHAAHAHAPLRGAAPSRRRRWRRLASSGSCVASERSATSTRCAWRLPPAAPTQTSGRPSRRLQAAIAALAWTWSQASIKTIHRRGQERGPVGRADEVFHTPNTSHPGWMAAMRSRSACTLAWPSVCSSACTWRLMLDSATWSRSKSTSCATPLRANASTVHEPTPPSPTTPMRASRRRR